MYIVIIDLCGNAPELGYWYFCKTLEEAQAMAKEAGFDEVPMPQKYYLGEYVEETNGEMIESPEDFAMRVIEVDLETLTHEANTAELRRTLALARR